MLIEFSFIEFVAIGPGTTDILGVRRSARGTSSFGQMTQSRHCIQKSKSLENETTCATTPEIRESEKLEKHKTLSSLRKSAKGLSELKKKKKEKYLIQVIVESEKAEVHQESVNMKRKKMTAHAFKSLFKRQHIKEIGEDLEGSDKLHACINNNKRIEFDPMGETVHVIDECIKRVEGSTIRDESIDKASDEPPDEPHEEFTCSTMRNTDADAPEAESSTCLGRLHGDALNSGSVENGTTTLFAMKENHGLLGTCTICLKEIRTSYNSQEKELCSCDATTDMELDGSSTFEKIASKDIDPGSEMDNIIKQIQRKCDKRMKKLIRKQKREIQEFHQIWEEKKLRLEADHKLESAFIRTIYSEGSDGVARLKQLDGIFGQKMKQNNLLKDTLLKDLEAQQLAARGLERQKAAYWLAEAKACCSREQTATRGGQSLGLQLEEDGGCSKASEQILGAKDVDPQTSQHLEDKNPSKTVSMQGNGVAQSDTFKDVPVQEVSSNTRIGSPIELASINPQNEGGIMVSERPTVAEVKQLDQTTLLSTGEIICVNLPPSGKRISDEMRSGELNKEVQSEVPGGQIRQSLPSAELQDRDVPVLEGQGTLQVEVASFELVGAVTPVQPHSEAQTIENCKLLEGQGTLQVEVANSEPVGAVTPVQSHFGAQTIENCQQLHLVSIDTPPSCNLSPATGVEYQGHDSGRNSQTAEAVDTVVLSRESSSHTGKYLETQCNHLDIGSASRVANETSIELSTPSQNSMSMSQAVVSTVEVPDHSVLQLGIDVHNVYGSSTPILHPNYQIASRNPQSLFQDPLENESEKIHKETEHLDQSHKDMMSHLKSECEKEIQEIIAQIRSKYNMKFQAAEADFRLKKNRLHKNCKKVLMNRVLAATFSLTCFALQSSGLSGMQQGIPSGFMRQSHQLPLQHSVRLTVGSSVCPPASCLQVSSPTSHSMQQLSVPHSTGHVTCPNVAAAPPLQVPHAMPLSCGPTSRSPVIKAINPTRDCCLVGGIRSPAPHFQTFRPAAVSSIPPATLLSVSHPQPLQPSQRLQPQSPAMSLQPCLQQMPSYQNQANPQDGLTAPHNPSVSALELLIDISHRSHIPANHDTLPLPEMLGNVQGSNQNPSAAASDVLMI